MPDSAGWVKHVYRSPYEPSVRRDGSSVARGRTWSGRTVREACGMLKGLGNFDPDFTSKSFDPSSSSGSTRGSVSSATADGVPVPTLGSSPRVTRILSPPYRRWGGGAARQRRDGGALEGVRAVKNPSTAPRSPSPSRWGGDGWEVATKNPPERAPAGQSVGVGTAGPSGRCPSRCGGSWRRSGRRR